MSKYFIAAPWWHFCGGLWTDSDELAATVSAVTGWPWFEGLRYYDAEHVREQLLAESTGLT